MNTVNFSKGQWAEGITVSRFETPRCLLWTERSRTERMGRDGSEEPECEKRDKIQEQKRKEQGRFMCLGGGTIIGGERKGQGVWRITRGITRSSPCWPEILVAVPPTGNKKQALKEINPLKKPGSNLQIQAIFITLMSLYFTYLLQHRLCCSTWLPRIIIIKYFLSEILSVSCFRLFIFQ